MRLIGKLGKYDVMIWPHGMIEIRDPRGLIYVRRANLKQAGLELAKKEQAIWKSWQQTAGVQSSIKKALNGYQAAKPQLAPPSDVEISSRIKEAYRMRKRARIDVILNFHMQRVFPT